MRICRNASFPGPRTQNQLGSTGHFIRLDSEFEYMENNPVKRFAACVALFSLSIAASLPAQTQQADVARYGPYPTNYKEIVMAWLGKQLIDPASARIEWLDQPKPADLGKNGQHLYGYLVHFKVDARNRFGAYTGPQTHGALIRNGEVVKGLGFGY